MGCGAIVFFLNPAVTGSEALGGSDEPLLDGFRAFLPANLAAVLSAFALIGLLASLQGIMYAYGRNMYSLSRAGYYPKTLSLTGSRQTPYVALLAGAVIGYIALLIVNYNEGAGAVVLNIAVWGAVLAYGLQMISFVLLRRKFPNAKRPWISPTGNWGAIVALIIAAITFVGVLVNPSYRPAVIAIVIFYVFGLLVFGFYGRHRLVLSPRRSTRSPAACTGTTRRPRGLAAPSRTRS